MEMQCTAFEGFRRIASGPLTDVVRAAKAVVDSRAEAMILIFEDATSRPVEIDFRGTPEQVLARLPQPRATETAAGEPRGPGRPKLGVVAREVTLLPRHWEWLGRQPGGASVALRKLVEEARRDAGGHDEKRVRQEAAFRFMAAMAGNAPGYEEATRALFSDDQKGFEAMSELWPADVRGHARRLAFGK